MPPSVDRSELATDSALYASIKPGDFLDCFSVASDIPARQAAQIITDFPGWARKLMTLRNLLVLPFGLKTDGGDIQDRVGIFPVTSETPDEVIAGFDDWHLNFRVSVLARDGRVSLATWVHRNNLVGRLYLATILPFHILIARNALSRLARHPGA